MYNYFFVISCHLQLRGGLQAYGRSSSPIPAQMPHAMPFRGLLSFAHRRSRVRSPPFFSVGVSPPRPHEPRHVRGPSPRPGTSLHKSKIKISPEASPSSRSNPPCGRGRLDCTLVGHCCPGAGPAHAINRSRVVGQISSWVRLSLHAGCNPQSPVPVIRRGAAVDAATRSAVLAVVAIDQVPPSKNGGLVYYCC